MDASIRVNSSVLILTWALACNAKILQEKVEKIIVKNFPDMPGRKDFEDFKSTNADIAKKLEAKSKICGGSIS